MSLSAQAPLAPDPGTPPGPDLGDGSGTPSASGPARPLVITGGIAACAAAASGLAVLITLTAIGWITAPHVGLGSGLVGVLRTAANLWLVAHHVGFTVRGAGRIGLLPLGLVLLPGALLVLAGRWVVRAGSVTRLRHVGYAAVALALPYALLAAAVALASRTPVAVPSLVQAVVASFLLALVAGGLGAARALAPWSRLAHLMPARPRSIICGTLGAGALLTAGGAALTAGSLAVHLTQVRAASDALAPGVGGAALLLLAQLAYVPNAIIWAVSYMLGPGFAFGAGTAVAPTGSSLGPVPIFPMLAAMPSGSHPGGPAWVPVVVLAMPYLAGVFAGVVTVRIAPTPQLEAAPLWGFAAGGAAGALAGLLAAFAGGPLGNGRLAAVGPSGFAVGLVAILEIGVTAALAAAAANWLILHRATRRRLAGQDPGPDRDFAPAGDQEWHEYGDQDEPRPGAPVDGGPDDGGPVDGGPDDGAPDGAVPSYRPLPRPGPAAALGALPSGMVDESDDDGGHRIYLNPWAADEAGADDRDSDLDDLDYFGGGHQNTARTKDAASTKDAARTKDAASTEGDSEGPDGTSPPRGGTPRW